MHGAITRITNKDIAKELTSMNDQCPILSLQAAQLPATIAKRPLPHTFRTESSATANRCMVVSNREINSDELGGEFCMYAVDALFDFERRAVKRISLLAVIRVLIGNPPGTD
jgi:hypothetical protein